MALTGCGGPQVSPEAMQLLQTGQDDYRGGNNTAAVEHLSAFLDQNPRSSVSDLAFYYRGRAKFRASDLAGARADLSQAAIMTRDKGLRASASILLGDIALRHNDLVAAEKMYRQAAENVDGPRPPLDYALLQLGCVLQRQGQWKQADAEFDRVIFLFDGQEAARLAGQRVRATAWTIYVAAQTDKPAAERLAASLAALKLPAAVRTTKKDRRLLFTVEVGRYNTYEEALGALPSAQAQEPAAAIIETR